MNLSTVSAVTAVGIALTAVAVALASLRRLRVLEQVVRRDIDQLALEIHQFATNVTSASPPPVTVRTSTIPAFTADVTVIPTRRPETRVEPASLPLETAFLTPPMEFEQLVRSVYAEWCYSGVPPAPTSQFEVVALRYSGAETASELSRPQRCFEEVEGSGELVRLTLPGATETLAWPHPSCVFDPYTHPLLFSGLSADGLRDPELRSQISPVKLVRIGQTWTTLPV